MPRRAHANKVDEYVAALHAAKRQLAAARLGLAKMTTPQGAVTLIEPKWRWAQHLIDNRAHSLLQYPGVVGVGLGSKVTSGRDTNVPCVTVFVVRKLKPQSLNRRSYSPLPRSLRKGRRTLPVDVVQVGALKRQAFVGQSCSVTSGVTRSATIGAPAVNSGSGVPVFITAMHVTGRLELTAASGTLPVNSPSISNLSSAPVVGQVIQGSRNGIDAAKVLLSSPHTVLRDVPTIGRIRGWRPTAFPGDKDTSVTMFGAASRVRQHGFIVHPAIFMASWGLDSAIVVRGFNTQDGDSGAALLDKERLVLGFLVGFAGDGLRIFCPVSLVLQRLGCDIPTLID